MQRTLWTERVFTLDLPEGWMWNIMERLHGTSVRIIELIHLLSPDVLELKPNGKWSIKEHIGHLIDLEELHEGRIDDFLEGKSILRAADMKNEKTENASHQTRTIKYLVEEFAKKRKQLINRLESLDDPTLQHNALHPRLKMMMKPVDMAYFIAEHDDHHLASIREIVTQKNA